MGIAEYGVTSVALPFNGALIPPNNNTGWTLKETMIREVYAYQTVALISEMSSNTNTSSTHELVCVWVRVPEQMKTKADSEEWM